jgi:RNA polymerase sigma-70 factor (ECF subfamily)
VRAWETADVAGLVALLRDDAVVSMPPGILIAGPQEIGAFMARSVFLDGTRIRLMPVETNGGPAFVIYSGSGPDAQLRAYAVLLVDVDVDVDGPSIARLSVYVDPRVIARFGLPGTLGG